GVQSQENPTIEWNRLRLTDLRIMCNKRNIPTEGFQPAKTDKGKAIERNSSEDYDNERPLPSDEVIEQCYAFLSHIENRLEQKLEERLGNSLSKVLDNSLQQWSVQLNKAS
ncbi:8892_t:CDS:2, partial [Racocetra persica]